MWCTAEDSSSRMVKGFPVVPYSSAPRTEARERQAIVMEEGSASASCGPESISGETKLAPAGERDEGSPPPPPPPPPSLHAAQSRARRSRGWRAAVLNGRDFLGFMLLLGLWRWLPLLAIPCTPSRLDEHERSVRSGFMKRSSVTAGLQRGAVCVRASRGLPERTHAPSEPVLRPAVGGRPERWGRAPGGGERAVDLRQQLYLSAARLSFPERLGQDNSPLKKRSGCIAQDSRAESRRQSGFVNRLISAGR